MQTLRTFAFALGTAIASDAHDALPLGPTDGRRDTSPYDAAAKVFYDDGTITHMSQHSINGYSLTAMVAIEDARRLMQEEHPSGFQTCAALFGEDFLESVVGMH